MGAEPPHSDENQPSVLSGAMSPISNIGNTHHLPDDSPHEHAEDVTLKPTGQKQSHGGTNDIMLHPAPSELSRYRIEGLLGRGGFASVFSGYDTQLLRNVAVKIAHQGFINLEEKEAFLHEARMIASLDHASILPVFDVGYSESGYGYVITKLVGGGDLSHQMKLGKLSRLDYIRVVISVAEALNHAHRRGIVHRDVKPANILLDIDMRVYLSDFGLAMTDASALKSPSAAGTPAYMSPEQARGEVHRLDGRSDIYSLGAVLFEALAKRRTFSANSDVDFMYMIATSEVRPIRQFDDSIEPELERIVMKALALKVADRYSTASDFARDLKVYVQNREGVEPASYSQLNASEIQDSDVVIAYSKIDDRPLPSEKLGWISYFQKNLSVRVEQLLGQPAKIVGFPVSPENSFDDTIVDAVPSAKTLVSVVTPAFAKTNGCSQILSRFAESAPIDSVKSRLIKIIKIPVSDQAYQKTLPPCFSCVPEFPFYKEDDGTGRVRELDERFGADSRLEYFERVYDVAESVCQSIRALTKAEVQEQPSEAEMTVYLAVTTSDLSAEREILRRELTARGCRVIPETPLSLNLEDLESEVRKMVEQSFLSIHPIGSVYGIVPEGAEESIVAIQYRVASKASCEQMIWIPREREVKDARQRRLVESITDAPDHGEHVEIIEDRLSTVKEVMVTKLEQQNAKKKKQRNPKSAALNSPARLYLICESVDEDATRDLEDFFYSQAIEVLLPAFDADEEETQETHIDNLLHCDGVIIYYGNSGRHWVDSNARDLVKALGYREGEPISVNVVYLAEPFDKRKERYRSLTIDVIRAGSEPGSFSELQPIVEKLKEAARQRATPVEAGQ